MKGIGWGNAPRNGLFAGLAAWFLLALEKEHYHSNLGIGMVAAVAIIAFALSLKRPPKLPF
ncbi:MAG: hypothetical protein WC004_03275 [Candidatus Absconditabacterales bacterium]